MDEEIDICEFLRAMFRVEAEVMRQIRETHPDKADSAEQVQILMEALSERSEEQLQAWAWAARVWVAGGELPPPRLRLVVGGTDG
jgi:hypothetical protein